jgi:hypothetical protein
VVLSFSPVGFVYVTVLKEAERSYREKASSISNSSNLPWIPFALLTPPGAALPQMEEPHKGNFPCSA